MDTVPGGETPQYESIKTVTKPSEKQEGQLGDESAASAERSDDPAKAEQGERTAENVRYGQNVSESGMGGQTTGMEGEANQDGYGGTDAQDQDEKLVSSRREQGHGPMPNIGA